jgi:ABC transporter ATM
LLRRQNVEQSGQNKQTQVPPAATIAETAKRGNLEAIQTKHSKTATSTKAPDLFSSSTVISKEQRKADWAILKEMAKYLWPKVNFETRFGGMLQAC